VTWFIAMGTFPAEPAEQINHVRPASIAQFLLWFQLMLGVRGLYGIETFWLLMMILGVDK